MRNLAGIALVFIVGAGTAALWVSLPRRAEAVSQLSLSPYELLLQMDVKSLPEQKINDPV